VTRGLTIPVTRPVPESDLGHMLDPHAFVALDAPAAVKCCACSTKPSHYRERRRRDGERRHLRRACHAGAVRREQRAAPPLPAVIDPGGLQKVAASVGRCDVCDPEPAGRSGGGVRLCEACYRRELRRRPGGATTPRHSCDSRCP
jgi:hypothetical protein